MAIGFWRHGIFKRAAGIGFGLVKILRAAGFADPRLADTRAAAIDGIVVVLMQLAAFIATIFKLAVYGFLALCEEAGTPLAAHGSIRLNSITQTHGFLSQAPAPLILFHNAAYACCALCSGAMS